MSRRCFILGYGAGIGEGAIGAALLALHEQPGSEVEVRFGGSPG